MEDLRSKKTWKYLQLTNKNMLKISPENEIKLSGIIIRQVLKNSWVTDTGKRKFKSLDTKNVNGKQKQIVNMIKRRISIKKSRLDLEKKYLENSIFEEEITKQYERLKDSNDQKKRNLNSRMKENQTGILT